MTSCSASRTAHLRRALISTAACSALAFGFGTPAFAQSAEGSEPEQSSRLPTIVVTATKRELTLQETPVAVSVVGSEEVERAEIQDLIDLQTLVPSLVVRQGQTSGNTTFFIRGFGNGSNAIGLEPSVGVFIDGVYRSRSAATISDLPNLQRVEVLRGPQSTLFGKNASAGVISVITRPPQFELEGFVSASLGNYSLRRLEGFITGPIAETLAVSVGGTFHQRDGYAEDLGTGADYNERDRWGIRADILFNPTSDISLRLIADYDKIDEDCCILTNLVEGPTGAIVRGLGGQFVSEDPFGYKVYYDLAPTSQIENSGVSLQGDFDLGFGTLTSITAFRSNENESQFDPDATNLRLFQANSQQAEIDTFTQEIRIQSTGQDNRVDWTVGGFYFDESIDVSNQILFGDDFRPFISALTGNPAALPTVEAFARLPPGTLAASGQGIVDSITQKNTAWSLFGTVDFHVTDRLTATVGLSYLEDEKTVTMNATSTDSLAALNLEQLGMNAALGGILQQNGVDITNPASVLPFIQSNPALYAQIQQQALGIALSEANAFDGLRELQFFPPFLNFPNDVENGMSRDTSTDFLARLSYEVTDEVSVYVSYATGFKASSWNLSRQSRPLPANFTPGNTVIDPVTQQVLLATPPSPVTDAGLNLVNLSSGTRFAEPEEAEVFELGVKTRFDTAAFNFTVFKQTIQNFQTNVFTSDRFVFANAAQQSTFGVEFDLTWSPTPALLLTAAATFLDPVYDSFPNFGPGIDISGQRPQGIADTQFSLGANYNFKIGTLDGFVRADWQHIGDSPFFDDPEQEAIMQQSGFSREQNLINMSVGLSTQSEIDVTLWARNLFDDQNIVAAVPSLAQAGSFNGAPNQPRTFGVTVRKSF